MTFPTTPALVDIFLRGALAEDAWTQPCQPARFASQELFTVDNGTVREAELKLLPALALAALVKHALNGICFPTMVTDSLL